MSDEKVNEKSNGVKLSENEIIRVETLSKRPSYAIPINNCEPNTYNQNKMNKERFEALKLDVTRGGQTGDILVKPKNINNYNFSSPPDKNDTFIIIDGYHRHLAMKELGLTKVTVKILDLNEADARLKTISMNKLHGATSEIGERRILDGFWDKDSKDFASIAMLDFVELVVPSQVIDIPIPEPILNTPISPSLANSISSEAVSDSGTKEQNTSDKIAPSQPVAQVENVPVRPEETFALPFFFKRTDYEYISDKCTKIKVQYKINNMADAFVYAFKAGEEAMAHAIENDRLKTKLEKMELVDTERKENAEKRQREKMLRELVKDKEKQKKDTEKLAKKQLEQ